MRKHAFSLIEMMVALSILLILIPAMLPIYSSYMEDIKEQALKERLLEIRRALHVFYMEHGRYPYQLFDEYGNNVDFLDPTKNELINGVHDGYGSYPPRRRRYLSELPVDPMSGKRDWLLVPVDNDSDGVYNEDPVEVTASTRLSTAVARPMTAAADAARESWNFYRIDNDGDGRIDEDPIDVGDVRSRTPGYENY